MIFVIIHILDRPFKEFLHVAWFLLSPIKLRTTLILHRSLNTPTHHSFIFSKIILMQEST